ncbi:D-alanyl-D-alanine carboxypeptidase/D-alanyl-D-alanine-endopeptidase [Thiomicrorhabdus sp.]|uniref:D-alanyl-D-alanine carboxypeptidase/D-alanyl-D-alanine-endopeptidase n=1 Tax=Thiomicrorhabdus sp. TaxID=2039724 RepID=UPI0029C92754|nr:D-alanyl-D-alanine carboxypeptidase [Thiomicrorhabdus sp.]
MDYRICKGRQRLSVPLLSVFLVLLLLLKVAWVEAGTQPPQAVLKKVADNSQAGLLWRDEKGKALREIRADQSFIPASTTKLVTALMALDHWGEDYRFKTEFYLLQNEDGAPALLIKGYGDPFLVSEELSMMAEEVVANLQQRGVPRIQRLLLDDGYYRDGTVLPGTGDSSNPYDAVPSALAANFNSIYIRRNSKQWMSAEPQTPLTELSKKVAQTQWDQHPFKGAERFNLGAETQAGSRYFGELFSLFLQQKGLQIEQAPVGRKISAAEHRDDLLMTYRNTRTLGEVIRSMLAFSTNFIANQLALNLAADASGKPADGDKVSRYYQQWLKSRFGWTSFHLEDGAGLSKENRLTPQQLSEVLKAFYPWRYLLPEIEPGIYAKTGTLKGVSCLAGYIVKEGHWQPFALMVNSPVAYHFRIQVAQALQSAGAK